MGAAGRQPGVLSVNVSGVEFVRGRIQETARKTLDTSQLPAQFLELEITESAIMSHAENSAQALDNLRPWASAWLSTISARATLRSPT
jgi:EAL domain-containing protein (putative c-di-GMP-specific phosphodiesterase class I)